MSELRYDLVLLLIATAGAAAALAWRHHRRLAFLWKWVVIGLGALHTWFRRRYRPKPPVQ